jgi:glycosyltransferase involved in cell wall biosynthesis
MTSPQVSVILIGFNDAGRLANALGSLRDQSFTDIEIIAVDDCSTDNSLEILRTAAASDPRIRVEVLSQNSGGCSAPRNRGMELAKAPFIMFCDSDDTFDSHAVRNMHSAIKCMKADLVIGAAKRIISNTGEVKIWRPELHKKSLVFDGLSQEPGLLFETISVNKIYGADFLRQNEISFPPGLLFEDQLFTLRCFLAAARIGVIPQVVYNWNVERGAQRDSITQSRRESRNVSDRIAINELMDRELEFDPVMTHHKNRKFLQHELSLYLTTLFELSEHESIELIENLSRYVRTIPIEDFECLRPGLRVATYYLLTGDQAKMRRALWWEKGGGFINTELVGVRRELWSHESTELMGYPASWWLNIGDLQLNLIPFEQRRYFVSLSKETSSINWRVSCVDFAGDLPSNSQLQIILREARTGALIAFTAVPIASEEGSRCFRVNLDLSSAELIQDRGVNSDEYGVVQVQITCALGVNRSDVHLQSGGELLSALSISRLASFDCADHIEFEVQSDLRLRWKASGSNKSLMSVVRKIRRSRNGKSTSSYLPITKVQNRTTVLYAPADLPSFDTALERFDTQLWIDEFGSSAYLMLPREVFTTRPQRSRYAYRSYSASQRKAVLAIADIVITDRPELIGDPRAIVFRKDLGAARYLLPDIGTATVGNQNELHQLIRARIESLEVQT